MFVPRRVAPGRSGLALRSPTPLRTTPSAEALEARMLLTGASFDPARTIAVGSVPQAVAAFDFNRDGKLDLAIGRDTSPTPVIDVLLGNGNGTFKTAVSYALPNPFFVTDLVVGDVTGDGK